MERKQIVAAYLRVSTDKQTILNQKSEVLNFCRKQDMQVTTWCTETVSGTKKENERQLGTLLKRLQQGDMTRYPDMQLSPSTEDHLLYRESKLHQRLTMDRQRQRIQIRHFYQ